jgi:DNA processing protein
MSQPGACEHCLRRAWVVAGLSARIERAMAGSPRKRAGELLALGEEELRRTLPPAEASVPPSPARMRAALERADVWACCRHDDGYPEQLRDLGKQAPASLFGRGDPTYLRRLDRRNCVTVVGSRRPSGYGRDTAALLGRELAAAGLAVISGMALGIDSSAHRGALEAGLTVAVLGGGSDAPSPVRMSRLYAEIVARGMIVSELPPGVAPRRWTFPARNRIMAGLGALVVVVEGRMRSGSLITAELAEQLGRDVGAVPGRVRTSAAAGPNQLLRDGAQVIRSGQDVLDSLLGPGTRVGGFSAPGGDLEPELAVVLELVEGGATTLDSVSREGGISAAAAGGALARLELIGRIRSDSGGRYRPAPD